MTYLTDLIEVLKDGSVDLHHDDLLVDVLVGDLHVLVWLCPDDEHHLLLELVQAWHVGLECNRVRARLDGEQELPQVQKLLKSIPISTVNRQLLLQ